MATRQLFLISLTILQASAVFAKDSVDESIPELMTLYKDLHAHPELSSHEQKTGKKIADALQRQLEIFAKIKSDADMAAGKAFLEENKKHKEVVTLPSGLQYMVISQNDSMTNKPKAYDTVVVNYIGTFIDGKEFENSYKRGQPGIFTVNVGIIKGWTEILQLMPVGAKWKVFIPSELGFGIAGAGNGAIPPNATVIFEISLEGIKPGTDPNPNK